MYEKNSMTRTIQICLANDIIGIPQPLYNTIVGAQKL